jgi:hypothetical protein
LSVCVGAVICERFAVGASPPVDTVAVCGGGVFGGAVGVWEDVEEALDVEQVEEAFDDAGCAGQDDGGVGFAAEWCRPSEQGSDAGAVEECGLAEVDYQVAVATADLAFDRFFEPRGVGEVDFAC